MYCHYTLATSFMNTPLLKLTICSSFPSWVGSPLLIGRKGTSLSAFRGCVAFKFRGNVVYDIGPPPPPGLPVPPRSVGEARVWWWADALIRWGWRNWTSSKQRDFRCCCCCCCCNCWWCCCCWWWCMQACPNCCGKIRTMFSPIQTIIRVELTSFNTRLLWLFPRKYQSELYLSRVGKVCIPYLTVKKRKIGD